MSHGSKAKYEVNVSFMVIAMITMALPVFAGLGLAVRFPDIVMEKVDPGTILNFRQDKNIPYVVMNRTDGPVDISVEAQVPSSKYLKDGYEAAPKAEWLKIVPSRFHLEKDEIASADVILSLPNDPSLVGRHFQIDINAHTTARGMVAAGIMHLMRFSVGTAGPDALKHEAAMKTLENMDLDLTPQSLRLEAAPLGRKLSLKDLKAGSLKVTNRSAAAVTLRLISMAVENNLKTPGYDAGNPLWLTVKPGLLKVKTDQIKEAELFLQVPDAPENRGRKFMFLVRGELEGLDFPMAIHSRIYVTTEGELQKKD